MYTVTYLYNLGFKGSASFAVCLQYLDGEGNANLFPAHDDIDRSLARLIDFVFQPFHDLLGYFRLYF